MTSSPSSAASSSSAGSSSPAFDYRDEQTKAKFLSMLGGAGKGGEKKGRRSGERKARAGPGAPASPTAASAEPQPSEAPAPAEAADANAASPHSSARKRPPRSPDPSPSLTEAALASLARAAGPLRRSPAAEKPRPGGKAAALAALSSRLRGAASPNAPTSPVHPNGHGADAADGEDGAGHSLLDPSPSAAAAAFSSPAHSDAAGSGNQSPSQSSALSAAAAVGGAGAAEENGGGDGAAEDEDDEDDEDARAAGHSLAVVESADSVHGVHRREQLDAMDQDAQLQRTMPWNNGQPGGGGRTPPARAKVASLARGNRPSLEPAPSSPPQVYGSLAPSPDVTGPSTPVDEADSPLTVANDYDLPSSAAPLPPPAQPRGGAASPASPPASSGSPDPSRAARIAASPSFGSGSSSSSSSYQPFTPSPTYFSAPMLPDLSAHGEHVKLILYPIRRQKRRVLLPLQSNACPQCGSTLRNRIFRRPRYCHFTGLYYCRLCHLKERAVVPGRVLWYGDVRRYKVCHMAFAFLRSIHAVPVLPMSAINPSLYRASKRLRYAFLLRQQLVYLRPFIEECDHRAELLVLFGERAYMLNDTPVLSTSARGIRTSFLDIVHSSEHAVSDATHPAARDMYSLLDMLSILEGALTERLSLLVSTLIAHVVHSDCEACGSKGAHCEGDGCTDRAPIYSFQVGSVIACEQCGSLFHRTCWSADGEPCPHCRRHVDAQQSVVVANRLADQVRRTPNRGPREPHAAAASGAGELGEGGGGRGRGGGGGGRGVLTEADDHGRDLEDDAGVVQW